MQQRPSLSANDTTATLKSGGIEYKKTDHISMDQEILKISSNEINILYKFTNDTDQTITTDVAFPLPPAPFTLGDSTRVYCNWDPLYKAYKVQSDAKKFIESKESMPSIYDSFLNDGSFQAFTNFKRTVNGMPYNHNFILQAKNPQGKDITAFLNKHNIPLSAMYLQGYMDTPGLEEDPALKKKLIDLGLVDSQMNVLWQLYITYVWSQEFPARRTIEVGHHYRPHTGYYWLDGKNKSSLKDLNFHHRDVNEDGTPEKKEILNYCPDQLQIQKLLKMFEVKLDNASDMEQIERFGITYHVSEIRYVLSTGANWKGPIKKFRLEIIPPSEDSLMMTCFPASFTKTEEGSYVTEIENFIPQQDLKILFIHPKSYTSS